MKRIECAAILFDLDGVLVDSAGYIEQQWRLWASSRGLEAEPFLRVCHGRRALETIRIAAPHLDAEAEVRALEPDEEPAAIEPLPGASRLLQALPDGSWAVVTSGRRPGALSRLCRAGLPVPEVLVCAEDVTAGKPSPEAYLLAAERLGTAPGVSLVVEDAPAGIEAARAAGMRAMALTTTHTADQLPTSVHAPSLAAVHLGRIDPDPGSPRRLELLIADQ